MFFPFKDYIVQSFNFNDGDTLLYTTTSKCMIQIEFTAIDIEAGEEVYIYVDAYGSVAEDVILFTTNGNLPSGSYMGPGQMIFPSGVSVRGISVNESNVQGILHIFELPSSP